MRGRILFSCAKVYPTHWASFEIKPDDRNSRQFGFSSAPSLNLNQNAFAEGRESTIMRIQVLFAAAGTILLAGMVEAQVPPLVEAELVKIGHIVEPGCTAKLYRPLFGKNDYNTYWPVDADMPNKNIKLFPGI